MRPQPSAHPEADRDASWRPFIFGYSKCNLHPKMDGLLVDGEFLHTRELLGVRFPKRKIQAVPSLGERDCRYLSFTTMYRWA